MAEDNLAEDLLDGMSEICRYLNIKERWGYELAEQGRLPLFKFGGRRWQGRKSTLLRHIQNMEADHAALT
jgi:excisionase family DNA binding protein